MMDTVEHLYKKMVKQEVRDFYSLEFKQSLEIYKSSFPSNERRPVEKIVEMLKNDENYHFFTFLYDNSVIGISTIYSFKTLGVGLLGYMAVSPEYQRRGIGKELFKFSFEKFKSDISNGIGLLMEIQKENVLEQHERIVRKNRINFYLGLGAKIMNGVDYLLPPLQPGFEPENMYLMVKPLEDLQYISKESVAKYIEAIYQTIYQYSENDLLNLILGKLPARITLRNEVN